MSEKQGRKFHHQLTLENLYRVKVYAWFVVFFELFMLARNIYKYGISKHLYVGFYVSFIVVAFIMLIFLKFYHPSDTNSKLANQWMFTYYLFTLLWGASVTIADQLSYGHVTAYLTNTLTAAILYPCSRKVFIWLHGIPIVYLAIGLILFQDKANILGGHFINITVFLIFAFLGARMIYNSFKRSFYQGAMLEQMNERLQEVAVRDELTQVKNRRGLYEYFSNELALQQRDVTVMLLDVDMFKGFNDFYGHVEGDRVLREVAAAIQRLAEREGHFIARYGGEEFVYVAFNISTDEAIALAEEIRQAVIELGIPHEKSKIAPHVTVSIGIAQQAVCDESMLMSLIQHADEMLYQAKEQGRNQVSMKV